MVVFEKRHKKEWFIGSACIDIYRDRILLEFIFSFLNVLSCCLVLTRSRS